MNKNHTPFLLLLSAMILSFSCAFGQVSFTNMSSSIYTTNGSGQEDCVLDMNGDHLDDIVRIMGNNMRINYQQPDGSFTETFFQLNLQSTPGWSMAGGDLNNDGFNDLIIGDGDAVSFLVAINGGTDYQEQTMPGYIFSQRTTMADIDNDGDLDAFTCHDVDQSHPYRNDGTGFMVEDQTLIQTLPYAGNYAAIWVDYDNDGDTDMYLTKCSQGAAPGDIKRTNAMYQNDGSGVFTEMAADINMADNAQSWATVFEDFDNDGDFDAFIVNHDSQNRFMENDGTGNFTDIIATTGIDANDLGAWENASGDFDNDGYVDILSELGHELYLNNGDMTFTGMDLNFDDGGIGDVNNDGFLDVVNGSSVYVNNTNNNNWIKINLQGNISNKCGIGARVEIHGDWGIQIREVRSGESFSPMSTLTAHFGIGQSTEVDQIIVKWPSGIITTVSTPTINEGILIVESECLLDPTAIAYTGSTTICEGESITLSVPTGFDNYYWSNGMNSASIEVTDAGTYNVVLIDANQCASVSDNVAISIISDPIPTIQTSGNVAFCDGGSVTLTSIEGQNLVWSNGETSQSIEVATSGNYSVSMDAICSTGQLTSETIEVTVYDYPETPEITSAILNADNSASLVATGNNPAWFDIPTGGFPIGFGNNFDSAPFADVTTFFVEDRNGSAGDFDTGGKIDIDGPGGLPSIGAYCFFDAFEPFTLLKVDVMVPNDGESGLRQIQLFDENNMMLAQKIIDLDIGMTTVELNFEVPVGTDFSLRCQQNNLFRNDGGVTYPYSIGNVGAITGSVFGAAYYYYFYNWQIQEESTTCASDRVFVNMTPVSINEIENIQQLAIFPNPSSADLTISFDAIDQGEMTISILNVIGKLAMEPLAQNITVGNNTYQLDVRNLAAGIYNVVLEMDGEKTVRKLVVE